MSPKSRTASHVVPISTRSPRGNGENSPPRRRIVDAFDGVIPEFAAAIAAKWQIRRETRRMCCAPSFGGRELGCCRNSTRSRLKSRTFSETRATTTRPTTVSQGETERNDNRRSLWRWRAPPRSSPASRRRAPLAGFKRRVNWNRWPGDRLDTRSLCFIQLFSGVCHAKSALVLWRFPAGYRACTR